MAKSSRLARRPAALKAAAALMLLLWLVTAALAACPQLHALVHSDATGEDHHCAATLVQQQSVLVTVPVIVAPALLPLGPELVQLPLSPLLVTHDFRLLPGRAPPLLFLSTTAAG